MSQQGPNPIEVYEAAVQAISSTVAGIESGQLSSSTPCTKWDVQALLNHNIRVAGFLRDVLNGISVEDPMDMMNVVGASLPAEGAEAALRAATSGAIAAAKQPGAMDKVFETPFGAMPGGHFIMLPFSDLVIHKWDLAKATNQDTSIDSGLAEVCFGVMSQGAEQGREMGLFGPEVQVSMTAGIQEKLLSMSGRQP